MQPESPSPSPGRPRPILCRLLESVAGLASEHLDPIWQSHLGSDQSLETLLINSGIVDDSMLAFLYSQHYLLPMFDPPDGSQPPIEPSIAGLLSEEFCRRRAIAPLADDGTTLEIAISSPDAFAYHEEIRQLTGRQMRPLFAPLGVVHRVLDLLYPSTSRSPVSSRATNFGPPERVDFEPLEPSEATRYVHALFERAMERGATEIHLEPFRGECRIRMRIAGSLVSVAPPNSILAPEVIAILRKLAKFDPDVIGQPQDGLIRLRHGRRRVAVHMHSFPTLGGDKIVLKLRSRETLPKRLDELGLAPGQLVRVRAALRPAAGMILVVGPPHSGKRGTLYSCLRYLNTAARNVCTVDAAVAYELAGVHRCPAPGTLDLSLADAVEALSRQSPDVLLFSNLGDPHSAAALMNTIAGGCLVLASMEAATVEEAIARFQAWGTDAGQLGQHLTLVVCQRRLRRLCGQCRTPRSYDASTLGRLSAWLDPDQPLLAYDAGGCEICRGTGYRGQVTAFDIADDVALEGPSTSAASLHAMAVARSPRWNLVDKLRDGLTTVEEVLRVI